MCERVRCCASSSLLLLPLPTPTTAPPIAAMACGLALLHGGALTFFVVVWHRKGEREGKCCDEEEMERTSRWKVDQCGTACALHPHPAAHDMPARCAVGDDHLTGLLCSALHGCSAWLLCFLPPCSPSPPHGGGEKRRRRGRGRRGSHVPPERSAHKCVHTLALDAERGMQQAAAHTHTHTHTCSWRASLLPHHSIKKGCGDRHGESVWWWWCGTLAGMQGVVAMVSCTAAQHGFHLCQAKRRERMREGKGVSG